MTTVPLFTLLTDCSQDTPRSSNDYYASYHTWRAEQKYGWPLDPVSYF